MFHDKMNKVEIYLAIIDFVQSKSFCTIRIANGKSFNFKFQQSTCTKKKTFLGSFQTLNCRLHVTWTCLSTSAIIRTNIPSVSSAAEDAWQLRHGKDDKDAQKYKLVHADVSYQKLMMTMLFDGFYTLRLTYFHIWFWIRTLKNKDS